MQLLLRGLQDFHAQVVCMPGWQLLGRGVGTRVARQSGAAGALVASEPGGQGGELVRGAAVASGVNVGVRAGQHGGVVGDVARRAVVPEAAWAVGGWPGGRRGRRRGRGWTPWRRAGSGEGRRRAGGGFAVARGWGRWQDGQGTMDPLGLVVPCAGRTGSAARKAYREGRPVGAAPELSLLLLAAALGCRGVNCRRVGGTNPPKSPTLLR